MIKKKKSEMIHLQVHLQMPCYDFILITDLAVVPSKRRAFRHYQLP